MKLLLLISFKGSQTITFSFYFGSFLSFLFIVANLIVSLACNFIKKETLAQVFSCEFCKISKNTFACRTPLGNCFCYSGKLIENVLSLVVQKPLGYVLKEVGVLKTKTQKRASSLWLFICCKTKLKKIVFFKKYTLFAEKNVFIWKKSFMMKKIFY